MRHKIVCLQNLVQTDILYAPVDRDEGNSRIFATCLFLWIIITIMNRELCRSLGGSVHAISLAFEGIFST